MEQHRERSFVLTLIGLLVIGLAAVAIYFLFLNPDGEGLIDDTTDETTETTEEENDNGTEEENQPLVSLDAEQNLAEIVLEKENLTEIVTFLEQSEFAEDFQDSTIRYTVFLPSDSGIDVENLSQDISVDEFLANHMIEGVLFAEDLLEKVDSEPLQTLGEAQLTITERDGLLYINDVLISEIQIETTNGVLYVVEGTF